MTLMCQKIVFYYIIYDKLLKCHLRELQNKGIAQKNVHKKG
jgi:hypothetical protein